MAVQGACGVSGQASDYGREAEIENDLFIGIFLPWSSPFF